MGQVVDLKPPLGEDEAFERYVRLVNERSEKGLWADLDLNQRIARAWDDWANLFLKRERRK